MSSAISGIDHVAITVADLDASVEFYRRVLGAVLVRDYEVDGRVIVKQVAIGGAMFNVHRTNHGFDLIAARPTPGSVDLCFRWRAPIGEAVALLDRAGVPIVEGPVERQASDGKLGSSVYFRDLDGNLLELLSTEPS